MAGRGGARGEAKGGERRGVRTRVDGGGEQSPREHPRVHGRPTEPRGLMAARTGSRTRAHTHARALHDGRPGFWCWRVLANSDTV